MFADMRAAYDTLPEAMKQRLAGLVGLHGRGDGPAGERLYDDELERRPTAIIPRRRGRRSIAIRSPAARSCSSTRCIRTALSAWTRDEAWPLIEELAAHSTQERFVYYHSWQVGDVLIWDERATMHRGAGDYEPRERRIMLRTIVYPN